jgi:beta-galactosidase
MTATAAAAVAPAGRRAPLEHETYAPWEGASVPRAWYEPKKAKVLDGSWRFRFSPTAAVAEDFTAPAFDDAAWDAIAVPAHWVLEGDGKYGLPAYQNIK